MLSAALLVWAAAPSVWAQTPLTGTTGPQTAPPPVTAPVTPPPGSRGRSLQERFDAANTTHDGHLTAEQARSGMPAVAKNFAAIDTERKGYVTLDQIRAYQRAVRAQRRAAKQVQ
jgi:hypothetical protein